MALQRIIDQQGMPEAGKARKPLNVFIDPMHVVRPQPVELTVGKN